MADKQYEPTDKPTHESSFHSTTTFSSTEPPLGPLHSSRPPPYPSVQQNTPPYPSSKQVANVPIRPKYQLVVRQEPLRGRACGFGSRMNPRIIDPTIILELRIWLEQDRCFSSNPSLMGDISRLVVTASLVSEDGHRDCSFVILPKEMSRLVSLQSQRQDNQETQGSPTIRSPNRTLSPQTLPYDSKMGRFIPTLFGAISSESHVITDMDGHKRVFFIFPEICMRVEGTYRLQFSMADLSRQVVDVGLLILRHNQGVSSSLCKVLTQPFISYKSRDFPGVVFSSDLVRHLYSQGVKLPIRNRPRLETRRLEYARKQRQD